MDSLLELLKMIGLPVVSIIILVLVFLIVKESWSLLRIQRISAYEEALKRTLDELDDRLKNFYLPLRERLSVTEHIFLDSKNFDVTITKGEIGPKPEIPGIYIQSNNERVFQDIIEHDILIPLNNQIVKLILDNKSYRDPLDETNYGALVNHYLLWGKLWEACDKDLIKRFSAVSVLDFPKEEAQNFYKVCQRLLDTRDRTRYDALNIREMSLQNKFLKPKVSKNPIYFSRQQQQQKLKENHESRN